MSSNSISHVFFGVGGVLLTPVPGAAEAVETLLFAHRRVRSPGSIRTALHQALQSSPTHSPQSLRWTPEDREIAVRVFEDLALEDEAEALSRTICEPGPGHGSWVLAPGAVAALELLRRDGVRTGVISAIGETLRQTLNAVGILPYLDEVLSIHESPSERRDAEQLATTLDKLQIKRESSWFIGTESEPALERARRAGLNILPLTPDADDADAETSEDAARYRRADEAVHRLLDGRG